MDQGKVWVLWLGPDVIKKNIIFNAAWEQFVRSCLHISGPSVSEVIWLICAVPPQLTASRSVRVFLTQTSAGPNKPWRKKSVKKKVYLGFTVQVIEKKRMPRINILNQVSGWSFQRGRKLKWTQMWSVINGRKRNSFQSECVDSERKQTNRSI